MSFYTSLKFYRPGLPPIISTNDLADFFIDVDRSGWLEVDDKFSLNLKYGNTIDADDRPTHWIESTDVPLIGTYAEIEWDTKLESDSLVDLSEQLRSKSNCIYRAFGVLGRLKEIVCEPITRPSCKQNGNGYYPEHLGFQIGPVENYALSMDDAVHVGWISLSVSGSGYLFPWEPKDIVSRAELSVPLMQLAAICCKHWPTNGEPPDWETIKTREALSETWPYTDVQKPIDWCWGTFESG